MIQLPIGSIARPVAFALAVSWLLGSGCGTTDRTPTERRPPLVEAVEARRGGLPLAETVPGVVRASNEVAVRSEVSARIAEVRVRSGAAVERGEVLVRLEADELREQFRRAEADVRLAEANAAEARARTAEIEARVRRLQRLAEDDLVSPQELETTVAQLEVSRAGTHASDARVEQATATVEERRAALQKTIVRSPVAGQVGERRVEVGTLVAPDSVLFRVGTLDRFIVELTLTEAMLARLEPGQPVVVRARGSDAEPIEARLDRISPFLAENSFTTVGEVDLEDPDRRLRPGMFVTVRILYGTSEEATLIPTSALWEDPRSGRRGVFVVVDSEGLEAPDAGRADNPESSRSVAFRSVNVLADGRGEVGVDGIAAGEWVVVAGQHLLRREIDDAAPADDAAPETTLARIRPASWERVSALQALQREDLLDGFLDKQRRVAEALGAEIPQSEEVVQRALGSVPGDR